MSRAIRRTLAQTVSQFKVFVESAKLSPRRLSLILSICVRELCNNGGPFQLICLSKILIFYCHLIYIGLLRMDKYSVSSCEFKCLCMRELVNLQEFIPGSRSLYFQNQWSGKLNEMHVLQTIASKLLSDDSNSIRRKKLKNLS